MGRAINGRAMTARDSGEGLIELMDGWVLRLGNGEDLSLQACWNTDLPRVSQWSVRYPGAVRDEAHARALIESPVWGIGVMNGLTELAANQIRFISSHGVGTGDAVIRFEVGEQAAAELQGVIGAEGGHIRIGATETRVQHNRRDVTASTVISFSLQF